MQPLIKTFKILKTGETLHGLTLCPHLQNHVWIYFTSSPSPHFHFKQVCEAAQWVLISQWFSVFEGDTQSSLTFTTLILTPTCYQNWFFWQFYVMPQSVSAFTSEEFNRITESTSHLLLVVSCLRGSHYRLYIWGVTGVEFGCWHRVNQSSHLVPRLLPLSHNCISFPLHPTTQVPPCQTSLQQPPVVVLHGYLAFPAKK